MDNNNMKYIQTDNLTVIDYGDNTGKLQIYQTTKSPYGYNSKTLITSDFGKPLKEITYNYVQKQVDKVYSTFNYDEIHKLINKINNENK
jgi:hypothetical protein